MLPDDFADILDRQSGVITRAQQLGRGAHQHDLERWLRRNEQRRVLPGVYVNHTGELSWLQRAWAAALWAEPAALAWGTAVRAGGGTPTPLRPDSTGPGRIHLLIGSGRVLHPPPWIGEHACISARGSLASSQMWPRGATSVLGQGFVRLVERPHGLPPALRQVKHETASGEVARDAIFLGARVVELDGRAFHQSVARRDADLERDLDAAVCGLDTTRLGWGQVFDRPCVTAGKVGSLLVRRGWRGAPTGCAASGCSAREVFRQAAW